MSVTSAANDMSDYNMIPWAVLNPPGIYLMAEETTEKKPSLRIAQQVKEEKESRKKETDGLGLSLSQ